jgi:diguanylate cyclase (GGDEF)-like protein/PAS domain S-box-containing protein
MKNKKISLSGKKSENRLSPGMIAFIYAVVGGIWILASDQVLNLITNDPARITQLQTYKGWFHVLITALMLYWLIRFYGKGLTRAMATLRDSEERFRVLVEQAPEAILVYDVDLNRFVDANVKATRLFGCQRDELLLSGAERFYSPVQPDGRPPRESMSVQIEHVLAGGDAVVERVIRSAAGREFICELRLVRLPSADRKLIRESIIDITERARIEKTMRNLIKGASSKIGKEFFSSMATQLAKALEADSTIIGEVIEGENAIRTVAFYREGTVVENFTYDLAGTPSDKVLNKGMCSYPSGVCDRFPEAKMLKQMEVEGYVGVSLTDSTNRTIGLMEAFYRRPVENVRFAESILQLFSLRTASEIERQKTEDSLRESRQQASFLADLLERSSQPFAVGYPDGRLASVNTAFAELTGYSKEELTTIDWASVLTPSEWHDIDLRKMEELTLTGRPVRYKKEYIRKDGSRVPIEFFAHVAKDEGGSPKYYYAFITDITERKRAEDEVIESRERFKNLVECSSDWVWEVDEHAVYTYASPKVHDILGYEPAELIGRTRFELMMPDEAERVYAFFRDIAASQRPFSLLENAILHKNGALVRLETSGVPFFDKTENLKGYRGIDRDITERKRAEDIIQYQAHHDLLTGLPNRVLCAELLDHQIHEMHCIDKRLAVLFLDIDQFKHINDSFGYAAGDKLIQHIALELKNSIRECDIVARIGGDEFALLMPLLNRPEDALIIAEKVMQTFKKPFIIEAHEVRLTASIGISLYPEDGPDAASLRKSADIALHFAKKQGRDNYQFFNASISHRTLERVIFENRLRQAVERGEMVVHYQPLQNIKTGKITGAEALVRWNHPDLGMLNPGKFIPLAEETGLIIEIDQWVLRTVCRQSKAWEEAGHGIPFITANLSARQFQQPALAGIIAEILNSTGLRPGSLGIEITETLAMRDTELTSRNLNQLNSMGVILLIDDFGTGYSSLSYLKKLPIHKLKIDQSFITDLALDKDDQAITNAIVAMAHILKLKVIAEGVETQEQESLLKSQDCDEMQGFLFSKPIPAAEFEELLASVAGNGDPET